MSADKIQPSEIVDGNKVGTYLSNAVITEAAITNGAIYSGGGLGKAFQGVAMALGVEMIARTCHEANRALCQAFGDDSQLPWAEAADWQRESAIKGVEFALANPAASPSAQHDAWYRDKVADGWVFGFTKDPVAKTHPCMVPYDQLSPEQKAKDYVFKAIVNAMSVPKSA